ncbi:hypothetical protein E2C01_036183 [Portunus trituberculatus]|uniref:Uncharacterized protein n=1 Tax=Portunus trituberculatus TaxID=210409 RepID=A0A5B7F648_PORTR|nr:hypothetical protein [Portunus trituberculatus]
MEYHDCLEEAEAQLAKDKAEAKAVLARKQAMIEQEEGERCSNCPGKSNLVEGEEQKLSIDDESVGKQSHLEQYINSQNELKAQAIAYQQTSNALPRNYVTFHDLKELTSYNEDNELMIRDDVDRQ